MLEIIKNPNQEEYEKVTQAVITNSGFCPCAVFKIEETKCICKEFRDKDTPGFCHCKRFLKVEKND